MYKYIIFSELCPAEHNPKKPKLIVGSGVGSRGKGKDWEQSVSRRIGLGEAYGEGTCYLIGNVGDGG